MSIYYMLSLFSVTHTHSDFDEHIEAKRGIQCLTQSAEDFVSVCELTTVLPFRPMKASLLPAVLIVQSTL